MVEKHRKSPQPLAPRAAGLYDSVRKHTCIESIPWMPGLPEAKYLSQFIPGLVVRSRKEGICSRPMGQEVGRCHMVFLLSLATGMVWTEALSFCTWQPAREPGDSRKTSWTPIQVSRPPSKEGIGRSRSNALREFVHILRQGQD